jgi:hypothetical protein
MTIVSSASPLSNKRVGKRYTKTRIAGIWTPAARVSRKIDFRRGYFQPIMRPVHVDTASASAVASKDIFMGSELGGGVAGDAFVGSGVSSFGPSGFAPSDLAELGGATFHGGR